MRKPVLALLVLLVLSRLFGFSSLLKYLIFNIPSPRRQTRQGRGYSR